MGSNQSVADFLICSKCCSKLDPAPEEQSLINTEIIATTQNNNQFDSDNTENSQIDNNQIERNKSNVDKLSFQQPEDLKNSANFNFNTWISQNKLSDIKHVFIRYDMIIMDNLSEQCKSYKCFLEDKELLQSYKKERRSALNAIEQLPINVDILQRTDFYDDEMKLFNFNNDDIDQNNNNNIKFVISSAIDDDGIPPIPMVHVTPSDTDSDNRDNDTYDGIIPLPQFQSISNQEHTISTASTAIITPIPSSYKGPDSSSFQFRQSLSYSDAQKSINVPSKIGDNDTLKGTM